MPTGAALPGAHILTGVHPTNVERSHSFLAETVKAKPCLAEQYFIVGRGETWNFVIKEIYKFVTQNGDISGCSGPILMKIVQNRIQCIRLV